MEALRQDDPRRIGPYATLLRLRETASAVQYLAHAPDGAPAVVSVARPALAGSPAFRRRFQAEAHTAERLAGGWVEAQLGSRTEGPELWTASGYVPALTLREAIALAGPLPERTVRILGAGLAETLSRAHATGAVLHGLAADTVLLASDGPRLTAFGALGAATAAEAGPGGQLSVRLDYLTPEQVAGQEPGPASDIFVLGLLLAYAATGTTPLAAGPQDAAADRIAHGDPELAAVPGELRPLIARCLSKSPENRPTPGTVAAELALEGAAAMARTGWLPDGLLTALAEQAGRVMGLGAGADSGAGSGGDLGAGGDLRSGATVVIRAGALRGGRGERVLPLPFPKLSTSFEQGRPHSSRSDNVLLPPRGGSAPDPAGAWGHAPSSGRGAVGESAAGTALTHPATALALPPAAPAQPPQLPALPSAHTTTGPVGNGLGGLSRRGLFAAIAAGAAGLVIGGGGALAIAGGDDTPSTSPRPDAEPAAAKKPLPGTAPAPLWHYRHPVELTSGSPSARIWHDKLLLIPGREQTTALDLRTGRRLWEQKAAGTGYRPEAADDTHCFVITRTDFVWLSAKDGQVKHRLPYGPLLAKGEDGEFTLGAKLAVDGPVAWFAGRIETPDVKRKGKKTEKVTRTRVYLFAYDMAARKELWRSEMADGHSGPFPRYEAVGVRPDSLLLRQEADSLTPAQKKKAKGRSSFVLVDRKSGKTLWQKYFDGVREGADTTDDTSGQLYAAVDDDLQAYDTRKGKGLWKIENTSGRFGRGVVSGKTLYLADSRSEVYAVDTATGTEQWKRDTEYPGRSTPSVVLSGSGRTVFALNDTQATAINARDGRRLWKFQDAGADDAGTPASYRAQTSGSTAVLWRGRNFYALPLD